MRAAVGEVMRLWRGAVRPADVAEYVTHFRDRVEPALLALSGFRGAEILTRPVDDVMEIVVHTRWASLNAVAAFAGPDHDRAVVEPEALAVLVARPCGRATSPSRTPAPRTDAGRNVCDSSDGHTMLDRI